MLNIFQKKIFLADHLAGLTDIHNHILPGIDDGAENLEASLNLLEFFEKLGIYQHIATPHIMNDLYPNTPETIRNAIGVLESELVVRKKKIQVKAAAEYMMDQAFLDNLEKDDLLCLKDRLILVEMSYFQPPINLKEILFRIKTRQLTPVLAHPERYVYFHSKNLTHFEELKNLGCSFQLNLLSLAGHYGKSIQKTAFQLLKRNMFDYVGTDTHQLRHLVKLENIRLSKKEIDLILPVIENTRNTFSY